MNALRRSLIALTGLVLASCGGAATDGTTAAGEGAALPGSLTVKPQSPVAIDYRIIGTAIVGQPLAIDIEVRSLIEPQALTLTYRINDSTALQLTEAQPAQVSIPPMELSEPAVQQVRLVPLREGRQFLNVTASIDAPDGTISTAIAVPIQVGPAPQGPATNGTITSDDAGESIHSLPATED